MAPQVSAISDSSDQSPPGKQNMQPPSSGEESMHSMKAGGKAMRMQSSQNDAPIHVGPVAVRRIQEELSQKGFEVGTADGVWGSSTSAAVKEFQKSQGLAATGKLDLETIQAMNIQDLIDGDSDAQGMHVQKVGKSFLGAQLFISPSQLKSIQQSLKDQGYEVGSADGIWGSKTKHAISTYQKDKGMAPTGGISVGMLEDMGMSQSIAALGIGSDDMQHAVQQSSNQAQARGYFGAEGEQQVDGTDQAQGIGAPLFAGSDMIQQVQQALKDAGKDPGQLDGKWSDGTRKAVERYQQSQNMQPTGTLTIGTLQKLVGSSGITPDIGIRRGSQPMPPQPMQESRPDTDQDRIVGGPGGASNPSGVYPGQGSVSQEPTGSQKTGTQRQY
jgi:peptidoglycan hydrolase-like protein with peptidoglycan-binding domain